MRGLIDQALSYLSDQIVCEMKTLATNVTVSAGATAGAYTLPTKSGYKMKVNGNTNITTTDAIRLTNLDIQVGSGICFEVGTNQVKIKRTGYYHVNGVFEASSVGNNTNVKRLALYKNGAECAVALGRVQSWETVSFSTILGFTAGDILTLHTRFDETSGTRTLQANSNFCIIPVS